MKAYITKTPKLSGTDFREVHRTASRLLKQILGRSKRKANVRSAYFRKEKIFLDLFWHHLFQKANWRDRTRRLKYLPPALELIRHTTFELRTKENPNTPGELLHRFIGMTPDREIFFVQIKEDRKSGRKDLISVFPDE